MFRNISFLLLTICCLFSCRTNKKIDNLDEGWTLLFNGKDLNNFRVLNGNAAYIVEEGTIVGISKSNTPNTFLSTKIDYSDFILEFEVWADTLLNSGVQIRSISDPKINEGRVRGYQIEIESSPRKWAGGIYDEARRGWLYSLEKNPKGQVAFKRNEWNHYRIEAIGSEITTWVNGIQCAHLIDEMTPSGLIGFQVHSIGDPKLENLKIKWKNIRIRTTNLESNRQKRTSSVEIINLTNG